MSPVIQARRPAGDDQAPVAFPGATKIVLTVDDGAGDAVQRRCAPQQRTVVEECGVHPVVGHEARETEAKSRIRESSAETALLSRIWFVGANLLRGVRLNALGSGTKFGTRFATNPHVPTPYSYCERSFLRSFISRTR